MYKSKSVNLLKVIIKICYILLLAVTVGAICFLVSKIKIHGYVAELKLMAIAFLAVVPAGYVALVSIDKLLTNIIKDAVFDYSSTRLLNIISIACFYSASVGAVGAVFLALSRVGFIFTSIEFVVIASGELFMGIVLQVIKQVFLKAIAIKEENELTI